VAKETVGLPIRRSDQIGNGVSWQRTIISKWLAVGRVRTLKISRPRLAGSRPSIAHPFLGAKLPVCGRWIVSACRGIGWCSRWRRAQARAIGHCSSSNWMRWMKSCARLISESRRSTHCLAKASETRSTQAPQPSSMVCRERVIIFS